MLTQKLIRVQFKPVGKSYNFALPDDIEVQTGDYVIIKGTPNINLVNSPEVPGGIGTIAMCVNMIPQVINAKPGLHTMLTLPIPRAIMGDMRQFIDEEMKIVK